MSRAQNKAKVIIIGDRGVGKTSLLLRFTDQKFSLYPRITIGTDFKERRVLLENCQITLEVWDTAGQESHKSLTNSFFRSSNGVVVMFDVTDSNSFQAIGRWLKEVEFRNVPLSRCVLVGNKTDLCSERVVDHSLAVAFANKNDLPYMETSAKDDVNVQQTFNSLTRQMVDQMNTTDTVIHSFKLEQKDSGGGGKKSSGCRC